MKIKGEILGQGVRANEKAAHVGRLAQIALNHRVEGAEPGGGTMLEGGMMGGGGKAEGKGWVLVTTGVICKRTVGPGSCGICTVYCLPAYSYRTW